MSNYSKIKTFDIANGKGIRTSIFFSGCDFKCRGCFNSELWDFNVGEPCGFDMYNKIKKSINEHIAGISLLGGEVLHPRNMEDVFTLCTRFKNDFPEKTIWMWTGSTFEELQSREGYEHDITFAILKFIDVLVDGRFIEEQKDLTLKFRGSKNQRLIDVQESLKQNKVVLYND